MITGVHHIRLRVRDLAASGAAMRMRLACSSRGSPTDVASSSLPGTPADGRFSEARIGLNHLLQDRDGVGA